MKPYLDPRQCGPKGRSITGYLIKVLDFVHKTLDLKKPHSVLAACIDLSKALNRVDNTQRVKFIQAGAELGLSPG